ncbi:DNA topoisomerase IB [Sphingobacterium sp. SYP-B4668]|uniref:DNA topoisomerase IB n=1 Tax=Sphingobacterium sp. SYP-B4668 TaxID=2996035 RepID=UPI0022DDB2CB|nr:DNA topoisomerase IB [Sphingobacterium sp. SYP-B4668]
MEDKISAHPAVDLNLRYVSGKEPGYSRKELKGKFVYFSDKGLVDDRDTIRRIEALVIPPAWKDVWICKRKNGHIQATGIDVRGRKQYKYHTDWSTLRNIKKFDRLMGFVKKLKLLRAQLAKDLRRKSLTKEKVCAIAVYTMSTTYIRAGNKSYEEEYGSFGLTTLKNRHIKIEHNQVFFKFKGKKGVLQQVYLKEPKVARLLKNVKELPGQELFQYYDTEGQLQRLDSGDINVYLRQAMQDDYTCKDFRTWAGCVLALLVMATEPFAETPAARKKALVAIIDAVALRLGNTRTVTRNYYIHPELQNQYITGNLQPLLSGLRKKNEVTTPGSATEKSLVKFLNSLKQSV